MRTILMIILPTILGLTIMLNGQILKTDDILASAWFAHHQINSHEVRTALELYYLDYGQYPNVKNSEKLFQTLYSNHYISGIPPKPKNYSYQYIPEQDTYKFTIK